AAFNGTRPGRYYGLGCLPNHDAKLATDELFHCATLGLHGAVFVPWGSAMPVWHEMWEPLWSAAEETGLVVSFHLFEGGGAPDSVMWGCDYTHRDGRWPFSQEAIEAQFNGIDPAIQRKMLWENVRRVYRIA